MRGLEYSGLMMIASIGHTRDLETPEAKARWFQSLSREERMDYLCEITDLILEINPSLAHRSNAQPTSRRIRILSIP